MARIYVPPPPTTFWDRHQTALLMGGGMLLALVLVPTGIGLAWLAYALLHWEDT